MDIIEKMKQEFSKKPARWHNHNELKFYVSMNPMNKLSVQSTRHEVMYGAFSSDSRLVQKFIDENEQELLEHFKGEKHV